MLFRMNINSKTILSVTTWLQTLSLNLCNNTIRKQKDMSNKFVEQYNMLHRIIKLIKEEQTGTPNVFCEKLNITQRTLYKYYNILKEMNCPVKYNRKLETYYFVGGCRVSKFR